MLLSLLDLREKYTDNLYQLVLIAPWRDYKAVLAHSKKIPPLNSASKIKLPDLVFIQHQFNSQKENIYDGITDVKYKELFFCLLEEMGSPLDPNLKTISSMFRTFLIDICSNRVSCFFLTNFLLSYKLMIWKSREPSDSSLFHWRSLLLRISSIKRSYQTMRAKKEW